ncbi:MAG: rod shape-determining protein RodA [Eubacteriaceae bacterium]
MKRIKNNYQKLDLGLIVSMTLLYLIGMVCIYVATNAEGVAKDGSQIYLIKQGVSFIIGCVMIVMMLKSDYNIFSRIWKWIYGISIFLLLIVFIPGIGTTNMGTTGWISFGFFEVQTSEIAKLGFILSFAKVLELRYNRLDFAEDLLVPLAFGIPPVILVALQPDLGQAFILVVIFLGMLFIAGFNIKYFYGLLGSGLVLIPTAWFLAYDYQKQRLLTFFNPELDPLGSGYQGIQSKITIGSGGFWGKGLGAEDSMVKLDFLPAQWTDFIFSVIGETMGFIGTVGVVLLFVYFLLRLLKDGKAGREMYGTLIVFGIFFMFFFQIIQNIGMTIGLLPITGITLPFISYGGSSLIVNMAAVGIVLNIHRQRLDII